MYLTKIILEIVTYRQSIAFSLILDEHPVIPPYPPLAKGGWGDLEFA